MPAHLALGLFCFPYQFARQIDNLKSGRFKDRPLRLWDAQKFEFSYRVDHCHAVGKVEHLSQEPDLPQVNQAAAIIQDNPHGVPPVLRLARAPLTPRAEWGN